jgi:hypothetical protein
MKGKKNGAKPCPLLSAHFPTSITLHVKGKDVPSEALNATENHGECPLYSRTPPSPRSEKQ